MDVLTSATSLLGALGAVVLQPEQVALPRQFSARGADGREDPDGPSGVTAYLSPGQPGAGGYVQLYDPTESSFLSLDEGTLLLDVVAPSRARALSLALRARALLAGTDEAPGEFAFQNLTALDGAPAWRVQLTFTQQLLFTGG